MQWASGLKDRVAAARINARIDRALLGNLGDHKSLRDGVSEMRIDVGAQAIVCTSPGAATQ